ncbi:hypothetical protein PR202_ga20479 [Eleusine coracana subsp. coracana]|uniref:DUF6598 domain-containing protein n=1 Tax=Eleusine coracana subsp. coracana TaxID=191504 RepID=A0AAV5CWT1_ELECO|nr:hypothetical protein PR202_ga20479 [Eleusine coracana subsp. coracana]
MMQIYVLKLAKIPMGVNSVQLYGYIAVRDERDSLLNYIVNHTRDAPITLQQGSFIEMTGPKRGISMCCSVLIEFDMRIKKGDREEDDLQLIYGTTDYCELGTPWKPFTNRINGDCGAVDITLALVYSAVEATIEVLVSKVHSHFNLSLSSFVFINESYQEIQHFHDTIGESCVLRRFVVAVVMDMDAFGVQGRSNSCKSVMDLSINR